LHSSRAPSKRTGPRGSASVRPASLATSFSKGQYASAGGGVAVVVVVVADVAGDVADVAGDVADDAGGEVVPAEDLA
jgi:hypothetical protein